MLDSLARQDDRPRQGVQMVRGRTTNTDPERELNFAFLQLPEALAKRLRNMPQYVLSDADAIARSRKS